MELLPLGGGLVERLEDLGDLDLFRSRGEEPLDGLEGRRMLGSGGEDLAVSGDRRVEIVQSKLVDLADAVFEFEDLVRRLTDLRFAREHLGEVTPALGADEKAIERDDRCLVL